jgi:hypothetical protein
MIAVTSLINRLFMFNHVPLLDRVPVLNRIPGIAGVTRIKRIDLPAADSARLEEAVNEQTVAFIAPNHPEFFTDWLLDKALSTRFAPLMASWATHAIVNGMGRVAQWFWLKNNLIAQIPGAGGAAGKKFSVEWALKGYSVLLHPEGQVGWHSDHIAPLFPGVVEMAFEAASQTCNTSYPRPVHIAPVVWKMRFIRDVSAALHREMSYVEKRLKLANGAQLSLEKRVDAAQREMLARAERKWGRDTTGEALSYGARHGFLMDSLLRVAEARLDLIGAAPEPGLPRSYRTRLESTGRYAEFTARLRRVEKAARARRKAGEVVSEETNRAVKTLQKLAMFMPELYTEASLTQEHLAETIKRLRQVYCRGTLRDELNAIAPLAAGPRVAHVRVAPALNINAYWMKTVDASPDKVARVKQAILDDLASSMETTLEGLTQELGQSLRNTYVNPFRE